MIQREGPADVRQRGQGVFVLEGRQNTVIAAGYSISNVAPVPFLDNGDDALRLLFGSATSASLFRLSPAVNGGRAGV